MPSRTVSDRSSPPDPSRARAMRFSNRFHWNLPSWNSTCEAHKCHFLSDVSKQDRLHEACHVTTCAHAGDWLPTCSQFLIEMKGMIVRHEPLLVFDLHMLMHHVLSQRQARCKCAAYQSIVSSFCLYVSISPAFTNTRIALEGCRQSASLLIQCKTSDHSMEQLTHPGQRCRGLHIG